MWDELREALGSLRWFAAAASAAALCLGGFGLLFCRKLSCAGKKIKWYGLLYGLSGAGTLKLSVAAVRLCFIVFSACSCARVTRLHLLFLALSWAAYSAVWPELSECLLDAVNTAAVFGALLAENVFVSYLREVRFEWNILIIAVLLALFLVQYAAYFFVRSAGRISNAQLFRGGTPDVEMETETSA